MTALNSSGTIVGSTQGALPAIPANSDFDYYGVIGGGISSLSGKVDEVRVDIASQASPTPRRLKTTNLSLSQDSGVNITSAPHQYKLTVKVTNNLGHPFGGLVHQQVVLYDAKGNVVGGEAGSSDNQPQTLPAGASYREK